MLSQKDPTQCLQGKHRVVYDDGEVGFEDLQQKKHKLPDLAGDQILNPDADAVSSSSDSEDDLVTGDLISQCTPVLLPLAASSDAVVSCIKHHIWNLSAGNVQDM